MDLYHLFRPIELRKDLEKMMKQTRSAFPAPAAAPTVGHGAGMTTVHVCLHVPSHAPMVDLAAALTQLAQRLNSAWDYRYQPGETRGAFHFYPLPPASEEGQP